MGQLWKVREWLEIAQGSPARQTEAGELGELCQWLYRFDRCAACELEGLQGRHGAQWREVGETRASIETEVLELFQGAEG